MTDSMQVVPASGGPNGTAETPSAPAQPNNVGLGQPHNRPPMSQTLLRFNPPALTTDVPAPLRKYIKASASATESTVGEEESKLPEIDSRKDAHRIHPEDILNHLFPPLHWQEEGDDWSQFVSTELATRMDVITLQEQLDLRCQQRNALKNGICAVREDLYEQCLDEMIRQVTLTCAERGVLLARIRDEFSMSMEAYKTMYETACQLSMRQSLLLEAKRKLLPQLQQLDEETAMAERRVNELKAKHDAIEKREIERRQADEMKHKEEVNFLKKGNLQLTNEIKRYMT